MSLILQAIGGEKLKQVGSVFAEGRNITRQLGGGIGPNSLFNNIPGLSSLMSGSGLNLPNPLSSMISPLTSQLTSLTSVVSSLNLQNQFSGLASQMMNASNAVSNFSSMINLLSGNAVPNMANNEFGLADVLRVSSAGTAALSDLTAPLSVAPATITNMISQLETLQGQVQSKQIADTDAMTALNTTLQPLVDAMNTSQNAYSSGQGQAAVQAMASEIFQYLDGSNSAEATYLAGLIDSTLATQIAAVIQAQAQPITE